MSAAPRSPVQPRLLLFDSRSAQRLEALPTLCENCARILGDRTPETLENFFELPAVKSASGEDNVVTMALLRLRGRDATAFLQGQVSNDVNALEPGAVQLAGYHNPQGRVIALLRLTRPSPEEFLAQLPLVLAEPVAQRLRRYVLRSNVTIEVLDAAASNIAALPADCNATRSRLADIAAGLPQVYAATSERFVAQMLNLDCIGAVSFSKGCYTGQEVIARAHYRGKVKRRMQRFVTVLPVVLVPGARYHLVDGRQLDIVDAAALDDGRSEFLAVAPLHPAVDEPAIATDPSALLDCEGLPLPYSLPD